MAVPKRLPHPARQSVPTASTGRRWTLTTTTTMSTECVGYVIILSDGVSVYVSGDTSTTEQMPEMALWDIDYAFFCCDGAFNMDTAEASQCAAMDRLAA